MLAKVRTALFDRGMSGIRGTSRVFKHFDSYDGNRRIDRQEFYVGLRELGVDVSKKDAQVLMDYLDRNRDGTIDYDEFLVGIRV